MNSFVIKLYDAKQTRDIDNVTFFSGSDESGSFGILANQARMMSILSKGLASFTLASGEKQYIACPGAVLYFNNNILTINTRHYIVDADHRRVRELLEREIENEESNTHRLKESLDRMEEAMLKRIWELERGQ